MAYTTKCLAAPPPQVIIIDRFVAGSGSLSAYPKATQAAFRETISANLALLRRTGKAKGSRAAPLLVRKEIANLGQAPKFLGSGDILLGLCHFPPYAKNKADLELDGPVAAIERGGSPLSQVVNRLHGSFVQTFTTRWRQIAEPQSRPPLMTPGSVSRGVKGRSQFLTFAATLKLAQDRSPNGKSVGKTKKAKGSGSRNVYFSARIGVIDVAMVAAEALEIYPQVFARKRAGKREALWKTLSGKHEFGPKAVSGITDTPYLEAVGRGLAYSLLHELWHAAERRSDHPFQDANNVIESEPSPVPKGLLFEPDSVKSIHKEYERTWCRYLSQRRINLGEIRI